MLILEVNESETSTLEVQLEEPDLEADPRAITDEEESRVWRFQCTVLGCTLTITRIDQNEGWKIKLRFRLYNPALERVPSFTSTSYTYMGEIGERAPHNTIVGIVDPSVLIIRDSAFSNCEQMIICIMGDCVHTILGYAFMGCISMKVIKLSRGIHFIGRRAFLDCKSVDALVFPPSLTDVEDFAFENCSHVRILPLLENVHNVGRNIFHECDALFAIPGIRQYEYDNLLNTTNDLEVIESINQVQQAIPILHRICLDPFVSEQTIHDCMEINGGPCTLHDAVRKIYHHMTPLHLLVTNPHVALDVIVACFNINICAAFEKDDLGMTPIDYLRKYSNFEALSSIVEALCVQR